MKLLEAWGFRHERRQGGHLVMIREGKRVQISAPERKMPTPYRALRRAAELCGVDLNTLLRCPVRPSAHAADEQLRVAQPCGCVVDENGFEPCSQHQQEEEVVVTPDKDVVVQRRRRTRRTDGTAPIAEVSWTHTNRGRQMVRDMGVTDSELDIEVLADFDTDEDQEFEPVASPRPTPTVESVSDESHEDPATQARYIFDSLFSEVPDELSEVVNIWLSATRLLIAASE